MSEKPSFFAELKRRNVYKIAVAYAVVAWLLIQVATQVFPFFEIPNWAVRLVVLLLIFGFRRAAHERHRASDSRALPRDWKWIPLRFAGVSPELGGSLPLTQPL